MRKKGVSSSEMFKFHQKLKQILKKAVKEDVILRNPCDQIDGIKSPEPKPRKSLSLEQAYKLASDFISKLNLIPKGEDGLTLNIYAHAIEQNDCEAAETIGNILDSQSHESTD